MSEWAICSKKQVIQSFAHFWWATWANHSLRSFLVSNLSDLLASLIKKEWMSKLLVFCERKSKWVICSKNEQFADLSWATWANRSQSLICPEQSERIAHSCSFDLKDLSKWANERIPNPVLFLLLLTLPAADLRLKYEEGLIGRWELIPHLLFPSEPLPCLLLPIGQTMCGG